MASHVVVIDSTLRRAMVKTNPGKYLSEVLEEACQKLNRTAIDHSLRYNKKQLDLALTFRLSGLPSGAQLDVVQTSRSPAVINVALQLPESERATRLTHKFPSNTTLWQILRQFESGVAGTGQIIPHNLNLTQRGVPTLSDGQSGAGRLFYEIPVLNLMGRELSTFRDLQKSLAQLGFNNGSCLIRLTFKNSEQPLEEAMSQISTYFNDPGQNAAHSSNSLDAQTVNIPGLNTTLHQDNVILPKKIREGEIPAGQASAPEAVIASSSHGEPQGDPLVNRSLGNATIYALNHASTSQSIVAPKATQSSSYLDQDSDNRLTIYAAPTSNTPSAAALNYDETDFEPTIDHAKLHQARLNRESRNKRLPSDLELAEAEREKAERTDTIQRLQIRIKLPDQQIVEATFDRSQTAEGLYGWIRGLLANGDQPFSLRYPSISGKQVLLAEEPKRLIADFKFQGRTLVHLTWEEGVSAEVRKMNVLKPELAGQARKLPMPIQEDAVLHTDTAGQKLLPDKKKALSKEDVENKMKKFLKFGKK